MDRFIITELIVCIIVFIFNKLMEKRVTNISIQRFLFKNNIK